MSITAWQLTSWPTYQWQIPDRTEHWPAFFHVQSNVSQCAPTGAEDLRHGDTVWVATIGSMVVGVGWEWIELRRGVFMLRDPNYLATNVCFLDKSLEPQSELDAIVSANRIAHALPWQATLSQVLAATRTAEDAAAAPLTNLHQLRSSGPYRLPTDNWSAAA